MTMVNKGAMTKTPDRFTPLIAPDCTVMTALTDHCFTTVQHTGTPAGQRIEISVGGVPVPTYLAEPAGDPPRRIILFFSDVFGAFYLNNQLVQDYFATQGKSNLVPVIARRVRIESRRGVLQLSDAGAYLDTFHRSNPCLTCVTI